MVDDEHLRHSPREPELLDWIWQNWCGRRTLGCWVPQCAKMFDSCCSWSVSLHKFSPRFSPVMWSRFYGLFWTKTKQMMWLCCPNFSTLKFVRKVSKVWLAKRRDSYYAVCGEDLFRWFSITKIYWLCDLNIRDQTQSQKPARGQPKDPIINSLQGLEPILRQFIQSVSF